MLSLTLIAGPASAAVPEVFGLGARWSALAGAGAAVVADGTATYTNPAGLAGVERPQASLGLSGAAARFEPSPPVWWDTDRDGLLTSDDPPLDWQPEMPPAVGLQLALARQIGSRFGIGAVAYVPTSTLIRFRTFEPALPTYPLWENRLNRFVLTAGFGGEIAPGLQLGVAVDLLAKVDVDVVATVEARAAPPDTTGSSQDDLVVDFHTVDLDVKPALAPVVGLQLDLGEWSSALRGLRLGAGYHAPVGLPLVVRADIQANLGLEGVGELDPYVAAVVATSELVLFDHYVPPRLQLGASWEWSDRLLLVADTRFTDWRQFELSVARAADAMVISPLVDVDTWRDGNPVRAELRSVWSLRCGTEVWSPEWDAGRRFRYLRLAGRAGLGLEPSPLVSQGPSTALLDSARVMMTAGMGMETWDPLGLTDGAMRLDVFGQVHVLATSSLPRTSAAPRAGYPVASDRIPVGGRILVAGGQWSFDY